MVEVDEKTIQDTGEGASSLRVLVVDDDADINRLLRVRLETRGYNVDTASDGEEALTWFDGSKSDPTPDVMFLDISMPGIDGLEVLRQVRSLGVDVAVILTTAFGSERVAIEALRQGADDYLRKPFEPGEFATVLQRTVARLQLSRQNAWLRGQLDEKRRQLEEELARAGKVQADLLPSETPRLRGFDLAALCVPSHEVGGDFYDWLQPEPDLSGANSPGVLTWALVDVMGKGMPAALLMATVRAAMRAVVRQNPNAPPSQTLAHITAALHDDLDRSGRFVTLFMAQLDIESGRMSYVDAGHGLGFIRRAAGSVETLGPRGLPLGVSLESTCPENEVTFAPGDALVVYSDGLVDACSDLLPDIEMLAHHLNGAPSASEMVRRLAGVAASGGPPNDDLTLVALYRKRERAIHNA